jgi:hypothetical protein
MKLLRHLLLIGVAALLGACATRSVQLRTFKIAGGVAVDLPMTKAGAMPVESYDVKIRLTGFVLDEDKREITYTFAFIEKKAAVPRSVRVDDVTGETAEILVIDTAPEITPSGYWQGNTMPRRKGDSSLDWLSDNGDTYKVFRFSITTADGRPLVIYQAAMWPADAKPLIRTILNVDGLPRPRIDSEDRE